MPSEYKISVSGLVLDQFRSIVNLARQRGIAELARDSGAYIMAELKSDPNHFGESRDKIPAAGIEMRIAFVGPICVRFGVHDQSKTVFIRSFRWDSRKE